jgi:hypothetical protein
MVGIKKRNALLKVINTFIELSYFPAAFSQAVRQLDFTSFLLAAGLRPI